ncbi:hypothetical protein D3C76_1335120 [compost metagenome]
MEITEITTPNQNAILTTIVCKVFGYDSGEAIDIEKIPEKEDKPGKIAELHYVEGSLEWVYKDKPLSDYEQLYAELSKANDTSLMALDALASTFEMTLMLQDTVTELQAEIERLKNGTVA